MISRNAAESPPRARATGPPGRRGGPPRLRRREPFVAGRIQPGRGRTFAARAMEPIMKPAGRLFFAAALASAAVTAALAQAPGRPNDAQIAHIAYTADDIDIKAGQLALRKSQNAQVRAFAQDMVRDHTAVNDKALALVKKLGVEPQDNDTSRTLTRQAEAEAKRLDGLNGP